MQDIYDSKNPIIIIILRDFSDYHFSSSPRYSTDNCFGFDDLSRYSNSIVQDNIAVYIAINSVLLDFVAVLRLINSRYFLIFTASTDDDDSNK